MDLMCLNPSKLEALTALDGKLFQAYCRWMERRTVGDHDSFSKEAGTWRHVHVLLN